MFNLRYTAYRRVGRVAALALVALLVTSVAVFAQATTSTVRGTVEDSSGGVLPGATVTITNVNTKAVATSVTDGRGGYQAVVFPGTYDLKVELEGFKTYEQKAVTHQPQRRPRHRRQAGGRRADRDRDRHGPDRSHPDGDGRP